MNPEQDVQSLIARVLDDAGAARLRNAFVGGLLPAQLAIACESVDGWVWSENPESLADLCGQEFADQYRSLWRLFLAVKGGNAKAASFRLTRWIDGVRAEHQDGSLPLVHHAVLQSTPGWVWDGPLQVPVLDRQMDVLESLLEDATTAGELVPDAVAFEFVGRC